MKLLRGQVEMVSEDNITLEVKVIDTVTQATVSQMSMGESIKERTELYRFVMKNCVGKLNIAGKNYDAEMLADCADFSDTDTMRTGLKIVAIVINKIFATEDEVKK